MYNRIGTYKWEMTADEIAAIREENARMAESEKNRPPTNEERLAAMEAAMIALMGVI